MHLFEALIFRLKCHFEISVMSKVFLFWEQLCYHAAHRADGGPWIPFLLRAGAFGFFFLCGLLQWMTSFHLFPLAFRQPCMNLWEWTWHCLAEKCRDFDKAPMGFLISLTISLVPWDLFVLRKKNRFIFLSSSHRPQIFSYAQVGENQFLWSIYVRVGKLW